MTIPQYMLANGGSAVNLFGSAADWAYVSGTGTKSDDAINKREAATSLKLAVDPAVFEYTVQRVLPADIDMSTQPTFRIMFYVDPASAYFNSVELRLSSTANPESFFKYLYARFHPLHKGWNAIDIYPSMWAVSGGQAWTVMKRAQIKINTYGDVGHNFVVSLDTLKMGVINTPAVMMTFDDAYLSVYTEAFAYMKTKRARGVHYIWTNEVNKAGNITSAQLLEMDAAGWSIANHTRSHPSLSALTQAEQEAQLSGAKADLDAWGLTKASMHVAYPSGNYNADTFLAMAATGMLTGRLIGGFTPLLTSYGDEEFVLPASKTLSNAVTLADAIAVVDAAVANKRLAIFYGHNLVETASSSTQWGIANFRALVDYIGSLGLPFITINDFYDLKSGPVTVQI